MNVVSITNKAGRLMGVWLMGVWLMGDGSFGVSRTMAQPAPGVMQYAPDFSPNTAPVPVRRVMQGEPRENSREPGLSGEDLEAAGSRRRRATTTLSQTSWHYIPPEEPRTLKLNDLVQVLVDEKSQVTSEGEMDRRKKADGTFALKDWVSLSGFALRPDKQSAGDPKVTGEMQSKYRAESGMESRDSMKFRIQCRVVDIRPNGNVLLEGRRTIRNNNDVWEMWMIGIVRPDDMLPNNSVLSENVADLRIIKREAGHVRDGYRRGWFTRWFDRHQPF